MESIDISSPINEMMVGDIAFEEYANFESVSGLKPDWDLLVKLGKGSPAHRYDWSRVLWEVHWGKKNLMLLVGRNAKQLSGIALLVMESTWKKGVRVNTLFPLNNFYAVHGTQLILSPSNAEFLDGTLGYLKKNYNYWNEWEMVFEKGEVETNNFEEKIHQYGYSYSIQMGDKSPYLNLQGSWEDFLKQKSSKFRSDLRVRERRLREKGKLKFRVFDGNSDWEKGLQDIFEIEMETWKQEGGSSILRIDKQRRFYERLAVFAARDSTLRLVILYLDGEPIAFDYSLSWEKIYFLLKTSYKENYREYCPGIVLRKLVIEWLYSEECLRIDFLGKDEPWKMKWTNTVCEHIFYRVFNNNLKGRWLWGVHKALEAWNLKT